MSYFDLHLKKVERVQNDDWLQWIGQSVLGRWISSWTDRPTNAQGREEGGDMKDIWSDILEDNDIYDFSQENEKCE